MSMKTVIIGGVAGGATTAARLRRRDETMEIVLLERGEYISYANCGLPYYVGEVIKERESLLLQTPEAMMKKFNIDVRTYNEVIEILPDEKMVKVKNHKTGETYDENYDSLVIATGSSPIRPRIPGIENPNIHTIWTVSDTDQIKESIHNHAKRAVVIGGGFIGLEMAENLHSIGLSVTLVEKSNQVMAPLDYEMANLIHENLLRNHVNLIFEDGVSEFMTGRNNTVQIVLESGRVVNTDIVVLAIGVKPNSQLAVSAGIAVNERGGIIVDTYMRTSKEHIYAVGDVIEVNNLVTDSKTMIPLAGPANKQARIVADNIVSNSQEDNWNQTLAKEYRGSLGTAIAKVFDYDVASVGMNEKQLQSAGLVKNSDYYSVLINQKSHAGYYPGSTPITLKMLFDASGKILGSQVVGKEGVDKKIDILATTIRLGGTIYDLEELELAYAPPFSSAKDAVNMLGFVAENVLNGLVTFTEWDELDQLDQNSEDTIILDVTEDMERYVYSIPNSYHIPLGQLRTRMDELDRQAKIIVYCAIGVRSYNAARILMQNGFEHVTVLSGGTAFYKSMHYDYELQAASIENEDSLARDNEKQIPTSTEKLTILNCSGLQCPGPIIKVNEAISNMKDKEMLQISATDMGFASDIKAWCRRTGNTFIAEERRGNENLVTIQKGFRKSDTNTGYLKEQLPQGKTIVVFSGDLDKVLASFIIANGAAAMGRPVTMFFTFWGLNALRRSNGKKVKKPFIDKMFGKMMPKGVKRLKLSKMNMAGMGTAMMKKVMKDKNVDSLEELMAQAMNSGVKLVACTMSMEVMGITKEELIDGVELAGVASYLGDAEVSNVNLFV